MTGQPSWNYVFEIFTVGGAAVVPKLHVLPVIRAVRKGECFISPLVHGAVARCGSPEDEPTDAAVLGEELSACERAIVDMLDRRSPVDPIRPVRGFPDYRSHERSATIHGGN